MASVLSSVDQFVEVVRNSGLIEEPRLDEALRTLTAAGTLPDKPADLAALWVREGLLTNLQASQLLQGKHRGYLINGKYKLLELLGAGGMGKVFLCEHVLLRRLVALKVLPIDQGEQDSSVERFYREARAVASLDHPNIVRAYDVDRDHKIHFLVMEYVDGRSLHELVSMKGPLGIRQAAHYISQAAHGLQHAHEAGWVHRDVKPGNILVDRQGVVKVLDLGLARLFHDACDTTTKKYDPECVLGTADYLAPEQAMNSHDVDIRADIYSLGATLYFCLAGQPPFVGGSPALKLLWHQTQMPKPIKELRPEVPEALARVLAKMMAKDPAKRYQIPIEVADTLAPWTQTPIPPPDLPLPCAAVQALNPPPSSGPRSPSPSSRLRPAPAGNTPAAAVVNTPAPREEAIPTRTMKGRPRSEKIPVAELDSSVRLKPVRKKRRRPPSRPRWLWMAAGGVGALTLGGLLFVVLAPGPKSDTPSGQGDGSASATRPIVPLPGPDHPIGPNEVLKYVNHRCTVAMVVQSVGTSRDSGLHFLNSERNYRSEKNLTVVLSPEVADRLPGPRGSDLKARFEGKMIHVRGVITLHQNRPQIEVTDPVQIQFIDQ